MMLAIWSLCIISFIGISQNLSRSIISSFYGIPELDDQPDIEFYVMKESPEFKDKFGKTAYAQYQVFYMIGQIPTLLILGPITQTCDRKLILGLATIISSAAVVLHAFAFELWHLYVLSFIVGFFQGMVSALPYQLPTLYFKD